MADQPTPRSYQAILSDMIDTFLSKYPIETLKVGSPLLTIMEAAAQSDLRSAQDLFNLLEADSLDQATGQSLLRKAHDEDIEPIKVTKSSGLVNFIDGSFEKVLTNVFQGSAAPTVGTTTIKVANASKFLPQGKLYIGRGTVNYEGPLSYSVTPVNNGSFWTITLDAGTTKPHNVNETVILAQGGDRVINVGTVIQTPQGNVATAVKFNVLNIGTILDGETTLNNIEVICQTPGTIGNVPANTITQLASSALNGIRVYNPLPFTNGLDAEDDDSLRDRIRDVRQSKQKATNLAINTHIKGISSSVDNKTVISSSIINPQSLSPTLIIDDGTGYEETIAGISSETLMDSALGGEQYFQLSSPRPIAKASVTTSQIGPFSLIDGSILAVNVGGVLSSHTFNSVDFKEISNSLSYEVVASINANATLLWSARTADNSNKITLFAKSEANEDIQVVAADGVDANSVLLFPSSRVYTLKLYTDKLLNKDGNKAFVSSFPQSTWSNIIQTGDTLIFSVDNTATQTLTVTDSDFATNATGFNSVNANNSLKAWADVLNTKLIGATATVNSGILTLTSNLGANNRAAIDITGGTLVTKGMFAASSAKGSESDYTLNRNTGQLKLKAPLVAGDKLTAASADTAAFIESGEIPTSTVTLSSNANLWMVVDGGAETLNTNLTGTSSFTLTSTATNRVRYTTSNDTFGSGSNHIINVNDWVVIWDPAFTDLGAFRIAQIDTTNHAWFEVDRMDITLDTGVIPDINGLVFVRTANQIQTITLPTGTYSLTALAALLNDKLIGAGASVVDSTKLRLTTNTLVNGDIAVVTADTQGQSLKLPLLLSVNKDPHYAVIESNNDIIGTPHFKWGTISATGSGSFTSDTTPANLALSSGDLIRFRKALNTTVVNFSQNDDVLSPIESIVGNVVTPAASSVLYKSVVGDRFYASNSYKLSAKDSLNLILDQDHISKTFSIPFFKSIKSDAGSVYGAASFNVLDSGTGVALSKGFGTDFSFNDFAVYMKARGKTHSISSNKTVLWRYSSFGTDGEKVGLRYVNPSAPSLGWGISTNTDTTQPFINISLPSGAEKGGLNLAGNSYFVVDSNTVFSYPGILSVARASGVVTLTTGNFDSHNLSVGDVIYQTSTDNGNFKAGPKVITAIGTNSISYSEAGSDATYTGILRSYLVPKSPSGNKNTITALSSSGTIVTATIGSHLFNVGDEIYFLPGHQDTGLTIPSGKKIVTAIASTTISWTEVASQTATATLVSGVTYTISTGQCVKVFVDYYKTVASIGLNRSSGIVFVNPETTPLVATHPYKVGDVVYLNSSDANFPAGPKLITFVDTSHFRYIEGGPDATATGINFFTMTSTDIDLTGGATPVVAGDIVHIDSKTSFNPSIVGDFRVHDVTSTSFSFFIPDTDFTGSGIPTKINAVTNLRFYPINSALATAASAAAFANTTSIVSAALVAANGETTKTGATVIDKATQEEFFLSINNASKNGAGTISVPYWSLLDGINWVKDTTMTGTTSGISLKNSVNGELTNNSDFVNEELRLVPVTMKNLTDYLNNSGSSGFYSNGIALASNGAKSLQLNSSLLGSDGAIQVTGGTANLTTATIYGTGQIINDSDGNPKYSKVLIPSSQVSGLVGNQYVSLQGQDPALKTTPWTKTSQITVTNGDTANEFLIHFSDNVVNVIQAVTGSTLQIEKHGRFMAYIDSSTVPATFSANIHEGDWVYISSTNLNGANVGIRQVVRIDPASHTFWVENDGVEEVATLSGSDFIKFITYDSVMPGDTLSIGFGNNIGNYVVEKLKESGSTTTATDFYVTGVMTAATATTLGDNYTLIKVKESNPIRLIKKIYSIVPDTVQTGYHNIIFDTSSYASKISNSYGALLTALDKLDFSTNLVIGTDGYSYNTGLLSEVNRVVYGDENNPTVYPGYVASGANLNISGSLIKRIKISLALRLRTNSINIIERVKNSVAASINGTPVGTSISLSSIVAAANSIDGVIAVTVISPIYSSGNDLIYVQANEKPRILNIDEDILVSVVGE